MDIVYIHDLRIDTIIGVYDWERQIKQTLSFNLEMATDIRQAAATDDLQYTINYKAVSDRLIEFVETTQPQLLETLAENIANIIISEFHVPWLRLQVSKAGAVRAARDVGLIIERGKKYGLPE
ncbi:7,8-dihydroneopterin aldolase [Cellvibrio zantedeschiae]|uniref:7,8-dihydroneopterin aldolase n=1 Tax=Cellvibrio zantedeschiae TaxID=1237077 RepID=A0ABQ3APE2_9GAMM|nr:dihydroneopterin aldolase [Cellvibrio zantedeschiae]GGY61604.1 7,8-dihydroneopterin aldolase [Cellvibrio zantedeschiae]